MTRPHEHAEPFSAEGLEQLLERAEHDRSAAEELDFLADLVAAAEIERLRLAPRARADAAPQGTLPPGKWLERQWLVAVAASLLFLGAMAVWLLLPRDDAGPASALALRDPPRYVAAELRAGEGPADEAFPRAMERYAADDHAGAAAALALWLDAHPEHGPARFYLAACREQLGLLDEAAAGYRAVADGQPGFLAQHARWRLAQLSLAREDVAGARAELRHLLESETSFGPGAAELLRQLDGR